MEAKIETPDVHAANEKASRLATPADRPTNRQLLNVASEPITRQRTKSAPVLMVPGPGMFKRKPSLTYPDECRVLLVDSDLQTIRLAQEILQKLGYDVCTVSARSGAEALRILRTNSMKFNLVLSDVHLPDMDGVDLIQEIKEISEDITIFMMSSTEDLDLVYQCLRDGADHYILKPLKEEHLKNFTQNVYRKKHEAEVLHQLKSEKHKSTELEEKTAKLESEVVELKQAIDEAVETPIRIISKELETLMQTHLPTEIILSTILKQLREVDIYKVAFKKILSEHEFVTNIDQGTHGLENSTRQWLQSVIGNPIEDNNNVEPLLSPPESRRKSNSFSRSDQDEQLLQQWHHTLRSYKFDVWSHEDETVLTQMILEIFISNHRYKKPEEQNGTESEDDGEEIVDIGGNLLERFGVTQEIFMNFVMEVKNNYSNKNPYHNFRHAVDVVQGCYSLLSTGRAALFLTPLEIFALLISALVHDVGHPGVNNNFQIMTGSPLAVRYNDRSVLENFHCSLAFTILRKPENDILAGLSAEQQKEVRNLMINCILATDLAQHMDILAKWNGIAYSFSKENKEHRVLLMQVVLKAADISNPARPFPIAKYWANMVQEEFFAQGDLEKERKLPVSPFMDRAQPALPKMQANFIDYLVIPLFSSVQCVLKRVKPFCDSLEANKKMWKSIIDNELKNGL